MGPCPRGGDAFIRGGGQHTTLIEARHPRRFSVDPKHMVWLVIAGRMLQNPFSGSQRRRLAQARCQINLVPTSRRSRPFKSIGMECSTRRFIANGLLNISLTAASPCYLDKTDSELSDTPTTRVTNDRENSTTKHLAHVFNGRPAGRRTPMFQVRFQGPTF